MSASEGAGYTYVSGGQSPITKETATSEWGSVLILAQGRSRSQGMLTHLVYRVARSEAVLSNGPSLLKGKA
jgi:hypothetical protein